MRAPHRPRRPSLPATPLLVTLSVHAGMTSDGREPAGAKLGRLVERELRKTDQAD